MSFLPKTIPPVGKSGPLIYLSKSSVVASLLSIRCTMASVISFRLCGGTLVAIPTAIPKVPFKIRFGTPAGRTAGSLRVFS